jgi:hypothetical protein
MKSKEVPKLFRVKQTRIPRNHLQTAKWPSIGRRSQQNGRSKEVVFSSV